MMKPEQENKWEELKEKALNEFNESGLLATNQCPDFLRDMYFKEGFEACVVKVQEEITQLKEELNSERFFSSKFELQAMRGFPTGKEWYYLVKEHLKIQKQRRIEL